MAVDSVKCALTSAKSSSTANNRLVFDCSVMTNVCSPGLAHSAQTKSPTRPQSASPALNTNNLDTSAEPNSNTASSVLNSTNTNSSAMQQLIETNLSPSTNPINDDRTASPVQSPKQHSSDKQQSNFIEADNSQDEQMDVEQSTEQQIKQEEHEENASRPITAQSPNHNIHHNVSNSNHSPQSIKETDRKVKGVSYILLLL